MSAARISGLAAAGAGAGAGTELGCPEWPSTTTTADKGARLASANQPPAEPQAIHKLNAAGSADRDRSASRSVSPPFSTSISWRRHRPAASDASSISSRLSLATGSIMSISPPPSSALSPTYTDSSYDQHGFVHGNPWATPKLGGVGRTPTASSLASPITLNSVLDDHPTLSPGLLPDADATMVPCYRPSSSRSVDVTDSECHSQSQQHQQHQFHHFRGEPIAVPFRLKRSRNRESWDSALGSDMNGPRTRGSSVAGLEGQPSLPVFGHHGEMQPPPARTPAQLPTSSPDSVIRLRPAFSPHRRPSFADNDYLQVPSTDLFDETSSETTVPAEDAAGRILNYTLDVAFGLGAYNVDASMCRSVVHNFLSDLGWAVNQAQEQKEMDEAQEPGSPCDASAADGQQPTRTGSSASRSSQGSSARGGGKGKRKSREGRDDEHNDGDEGGADDGDTKQPEPGPSKRAKLEPGVRMSCPYRKKNPLRFNVRDHRLCALTVFTDTAELRRHIQDCHRRPAHSPHRCPRCQVQFFSADSLRDHLLFLDGVLCPVVDSGALDGTAVHNPEDGIDNTTAEKLRSKKGRVSDTVDVQWQKIWDLLFPGTEVQPYEYCAVMEHHELYAKYLSSMPSLKTSLSAIGLHERGLETLDGILTNHLIELFEQCNEEGRRKDYRNRQPKGAALAASTGLRQQHQQQPATVAAVASGQLRKQSSLRQRLAAAQRDSGFVDDDHSVVGGLQDAAGGGCSSEGGLGICTPAFTSDDGSSPGLAFRNPQHKVAAAATPGNQAPYHHHQAAAAAQVTGFPPSLDGGLMHSVPAGMHGDMMPDSTTMGHFADAVEGMQDPFVDYTHAVDCVDGDYAPAHLGEDPGFPVYNSIGQNNGMLNMAAVDFTSGRGFGDEQDSTSAWVYSQRL